MLYSPRQAVEIFHLQFLRLLTGESDRGHYTLKGGCNLRFFFGSVRYSEDMDLDVAVVATTTLRNKVDRLLGGRPLATLLGAAGLGISGANAPKQTETTQRWKIVLRMEGMSTPVRTKIEMSRRVASGKTVFEAIRRDLAAAYKLTPPLVGHYTPSAALAQKIEALAGRKEPQARDVFDLHLLIPQVEQRLNAARIRARLPLALENGLDISYDDYRAQVVAFLEPEHQDALGSRQHWDHIQTTVVQYLEGLRP